MKNEPKNQPASGVPAVPLTLDGSYMLHQLFRMRWSASRALAASDQTHILDRATTRLVPLEQNKQEPSALFSLLGHKGDLMIVHLRRTLVAFNDADLRLP